MVSGAPTQFVDIEGMKMKINSKDFRVRPGEKVQLREWPTPVLDVWNSSPPNDFPNYASGTWGPDSTQGLLVQQGHSWPAPVELAGRPK
jgi:glucose-6-phosphate 1-dehydrogenase